MTRVRRLVCICARVLVPGLLMAATVGCGKKGPPLAPLHLLPERVSDFTVRRIGGDIYLRLVVPAKNQDGSSPADLTRVEVYALTDDPKLAAPEPLEDQPRRRDVATGEGGRGRTPLEDQPRRRGAPPSEGARALTERSSELLTNAVLIASIEVRPPPPPEEEGSGDTKDTTAPQVPAPPPDPRPAQGAVVTFVEAVTPQLLVPVDHMAADKETKKDEEEEESLERAGAAEAVVFPIAPPSAEPSLVRTYIAIGVSRNKSKGPFSARRGAPLDPPPPPPTGVAATFTKDAILLAWTPPAGGPRPIQAPAAEGTLPSQPILGELSPFSYNVYENSVHWDQVSGAGATVLAASPVDMPKPINASPLEGPPFRDDRLEVGVERCYVVRTLQRFGAMTIESEESEGVCVTPVDTFPPAAPQGLTAIGSAGAISLIWEASPDADVAGYVVLRGEAPGETLQALMADPIRETTFRDMKVRPGVRYVYAVVAVDKAKPPNVSPQSNRVEESAR